MLSHKKFSLKKFSLVDARGHLRLVAVVALIFMWAFGWVAASAQAWPELDGVVSDDTGRLSSEQINQVNEAAAELERLGIQPLAVLSQNLKGLPDSEELAYAAAAQYGFGGANRQLDADVFAIVVVLNPREITILSGDSVAPIMSQVRDGRAVDDQIRADYIIPQLSSGDFAAAFSEGFRQAAREADLFQNPPTPTTAPTPAPAVVTNIDTSGLGSALLWCVGIVALLGVVGVGGPVLFRQWKRAQEAAARKRALQDQLVQARNVAADMITDLDFPADPAEQIQYRFLALALERERPAQLADITKRYKEVYGRVSDALELYNTLNQAKPATEQELTAAITQYQSVQATIQEASAFLQQLAEMSKQVEGQVSAAPGEADAAKKALAAATDSLAQLAAAAPDLYAPSTQRALKPVADRVAEAESALAAQPPLSLKAYDAATTASASIAQLLALIGSLAQAYHALRQQRARLVAARSGAFKLPGSDKTFAHALDVLSDAARHLEASEWEKAGETLKQGVEAVEQAGSEVDAAVSLQKANVEALAALKAAGEEVKTFIEQGAAAFDKVDEYAESSWQDIKGNGTEAQKAADKAFNLWQEASRLNELSAEGPQDFEGARRLIEEANASIVRVRELITAILDRLKHLQESQRTAQAEISAAEQDLALGRSFVKQHDPDIGPAPDRLLADAAGLISQAKEERSKGKPDWIKVVALARQANDLADRALAGARSE
ncbi:MAG TPA: TPM domain-containing protein, partial [Chloroflexia bacterium]|nr:TPM domain-containing protein [Chloroflexia bacterium]